MTYAFRFLEDIAVADLAFEVEADSVEELFRGAACAVIDTMANPETVGASWERAIRRTDPDPATLLFDWLSEIIYWKDAAGVVFHEASLTVAQEAASWTLHATLTGAPVDMRTQELRNDVKGVTKHLYEVKQEGTQWTARVVLDV